MNRNRQELTKNEVQYINSLVGDYMDLTSIHFGNRPRGVVRYDKRPEMYGGNGVVFLLQMFSDAELVNNRIGAFMVLPTSSDSVGFHTHGTRKEQELYLILEGEGIYLEKEKWQSPEKEYKVKKGNITTIKGSGFHGLRNTGDKPLIVFVITTNEK